MKKITVLLFLAACGGAPVQQQEPTAESTNAGKADAYGYCHIDVQDATNTVQLAIDYKLVSTNGNQVTNTATSVWLNARGIPSTAHVQAALTVYGYPSECPNDDCGGPEDSLALSKVYDMSYQNGRFTTALSDLPITQYFEGDDIATEYDWQLAIVADGVWYKNGNSNMQSFPADIDGFCGAGTTF